jgi:hypothetical protein
MELSHQNALLTAAMTALTSKSQEAQVGAKKAAIGGLVSNPVTAEHVQTPVKKVDNEEVIVEFDKQTDSAKTT